MILKIYTTWAWKFFFGISEMVSDEEIERKNEEVLTEKG